MVDRSLPAGLLALLAALATGACAASLPEVRPWPGPPEGSACRVVIERSDATGSWELEHHHAADGRVLAGTTRLRYHGVGWERFDYDEAGSLRAIELHEAIEAESFPCGSEEGCDTPPLREMTYVRVQHDEEGRLTEWDLAKRTENLVDGSWSVRTRESNDLSYSYGEGGRLAALHGSNGTTRFLYDGEQLVRVERDADYPWYRTIEHDSSGRIVRMVHMSCTRERVCGATQRIFFVYDADGRLVRAEHSDPSGSEAPTIDAWEYDGERVVRASRATARAAGEEAQVFEYAYDEEGRLASVTENGRLREAYRYEGECDALRTRPATPSAEGLVGASTCHFSPGYVLDTCATR